MVQAYVVRRKADGKFYKNAAKPARAWRMTPEQLRAAEEASHWTDDLQKARTYTNRGGGQCDPVSRRQERLRVPAG